MFKPGQRVKALCDCVNEGRYYKQGYEGTTIRMVDNDQQVYVKWDVPSYGDNNWYAYVEHLEAI